MIKKILVGFFLIVLMSVSVLGVGNYNGNSDTQGSNVDINVQDKIMEQVKIKGLETAQLRVRNEEQKQNLEQVMNKIQNKQREQLQKLDDLIFIESKLNTEEFVVEGKIDAVFLGIFKYKKIMRYNINNEGELIYRQGLIDLFSKIENKPII